MNKKTISLIVIFAAFLAGAYLSVLDPVTVNWNFLAPVLAVGAVGLWGYRTAVHSEASAGEKVAGNMQLLGDSLSNLSRNLGELNSRKTDLPVYEARFEIDRLFREDLNNFADARESMIHVFGMKNYADVMSAFAAGERYINRVWSASTDGYQDEVYKYLERASLQFAEADQLFKSLLDDQETPADQPGASSPGAV